ncbi:M23 family metallopeptidase [Microbacterium sp. AG238]|uniref:M23 family metallopeptidase n=1 Tax=Microbacterium sp. AG238 TaxID=2183994 RepID=UPI000E75684B|nr:M23 family metallopeptidase [Microbacterium sp. AG238]
MPTLSRPVEPDAPYKGGWGSYTGHRGIDYGWWTADPVRTQRVYAALGGRVSSVYRDGGNNNDWGNRVIIDHGYGIQTTYSHLRTGDVYVNVGDLVSTGHHLARMGTTGRSDGVHLHFELYIDGDRVDPEPYFITPLPRIPNTPQPEPEPEDDMFTDEDRNLLRGAATAARPLIRRPDGSVFFADPIGADHLGDFRSADIGVGEFLATAENVWGTPKSVGAREFDIAVAIANRRWDRKREQIVDAVVAAIAAQ